MPSAAYDLIAKAIASRAEEIETGVQSGKPTIVSATYKGYVRQMCPMVLGYRDGIERALLYQFAGGSKSGNPEGWKCMDVGDLRDVLLIVGKWHDPPPRVGGRPSRCVTDVKLSLGDWLP